MPLPICFAPLQGYTEDAYRRIHSQMCGGVDEYYSPFLRIEQGEIRKKDNLDIRPSFNQDVPLVIQFIAKDAMEMGLLLEAVERHRASWQKEMEVNATSPGSMGRTWADAERIRIDVNMGCPFPMQVKHGRGAGILVDPEKVKAVCEFIQAHTEYDFSVKMRLGVDGPEEWRQVLPLLNDTPLRHITLHPRFARQQYKGEPDRGMFEEFLQTCRHPVVYNGDITTLEQLQELERRYPQLAGVMIGRGLLARPTLAREYKTNIPATNSEVTGTLKRMHEALCQYYADRIPGETQQLNKLRTFWDYCEPTIGHKAWKMIHKAGNMKNYLREIGNIPS